MDRDLIRRAKQGDKDAFTSLVLRHGDRLYSVAFRILRDATRAEDAVQQAFLMAWRELRRLRDEDRLEAWLYRLLVNACFAEIRQTRRWQPGLRVITDLDVGPITDDAQAGVALRDELERAFRRLSGEQRAVLVMHHYLGLSGEEIARARARTGHRPIATPLRPTTDARVDRGRFAPHGDGRTGMNREVNVDQILDSWFTEGPTDLPDRTVTAIVEGLDGVHQRRPIWLPWRPSMPRTASAVASVAIVLLASILALGLYFNHPNFAVSPSPSPSASPTPTPAGSAIFTDIAPGEMVEIPDWPLTERTNPPSVWTGTELIAWSDGIYGSADDGAAFNLATGLWRVIAEAPLSPRSESAVAWTGTEMIVWGGRVGNTFFDDGAAYDPETDTWRRLAPGPTSFPKDPIMVWTGAEAVVLGVGGDSETTGEFIVGGAYDPVADTWRAIAPAPASFLLAPGAWWTGESVVVAAVTDEFDAVARYDVAADRWSIADIGSSAAVVGVPDGSGLVTTFLVLPSETGAATRLIDSAGNLVEQLPAFPGDRAVFGHQIGASGLWVGEEAVFEIWNGADEEPEQIWALNPVSRTWRQLDTDTAFPRIDNSVRAAGDLLLTWNRPGDVYQGRVCCVAPPSRGGAIYRIGL